MIFLNLRNIVVVMKTFLLLLGLLFMGDVLAAKWSLQITNPEYELKNISLPDKKFRPFLPKTSWHCIFGPTLSKGEGKEKREEKSIYCNYSVKKAGAFTTYLSCSASRPYSESKFDLLDQRKKLLFQMLLICQYE